MVWISSGTRLAFGREGTRATAPAAFGGTGGSTSPRLLGIVNQGFEMMDPVTDVREYNNFGTGRRRFLIKDGKIEYPAQGIPFLPTTGELFYYAFGTEVIQNDLIDGAASTGHNTHTMLTDDKGTIPTNVASSSESTDANATSLPTFTLSGIYEGSPNFRRDFLGCTVNSMNISLSEGQELQANLEIRAMDEQNHDSASPTLWSQPTDDGTGNVQPWLFYDRTADVTTGGTYDYTANSITGGRTWANVRSFSCSLSNNLKPIYVSNSGGSQKVWRFVTSNPSFNLSIELVPDAQLSSTDNDAVYDMLAGGVQGDVLIPFSRGTNDRLDFVFEDALIRQAPHGFKDDGGEITVTCDVAVEEFRVVARDSLSAYGTL